MGLNFRGRSFTLREPFSRINEVDANRECSELFDTALEKTKGLTQDQLVSCFISGLKPNISAELEISKPSNLTTATLLAKKYERKFNIKRTLWGHANTSGGCVTN